MGMMKAAKLCPQAIVLPVDFEEVRKYSRLFKSTIAEIAPVMEDRGVDEVYIDFTDVPGGQREGGRVLARLIQRAIFEATGLTCSIGVAPNKLIAKMASEFNKPNGISIVYAGRRADEDLAPAGAQDQRHRPEGGGQARQAAPAHHRRHRGAAARVADRQLRQGLRRLDARCGLGPRRPARGDRERAGVDEPRNHLRPRPARRARPGRAGRHLHRPVRAAWPATCSARATSARPSASSCATTTSGSPRATRPSRISRPTRKTIRHIAGQCLKRVDLARRLRLLGVRVGKLVKADAPPEPQPCRRAAPQPGTLDLF